MTTQSEIIAESCKASLELLQMTVGDFSDADLYVRPCPGANHAAWQLGHLAESEHGMVEMAKPGSMPALPAGFADRFGQKANQKDDPAAFATTKADLLKVLGEVRAATAKWIRSLDQAAMNQPAPEPMRPYAPTVGALVMMILQHHGMHQGQLQVIRRKLGKPVLF